MDNVVHSSIVQITPSLLAKSGGPAYSVPRLAKALALKGQDVTLRTHETDEYGELATQSFNCEVLPYAYGALGRRLGLSPALMTSLKRDAVQGRIIHTHGLWHPVGLYPSWVKQKNPDAILVHAPRGMLGKQALKLSAWKKQPYWHLFQRNALASANCLHATAVSECEEIRQAGITNPIAIVPNGIDIPVRDRLSSQKKFPKQVLSLGRIHPKKGLDRLIDAWARIEDRFPDWRLRIVGPSESKFDQQLLRLISRLSLRRVSIEPPVYGSDKAALYSQAHLFVLPTRNENFAMTVAEALSFGTPVISTKGAPWSDLETHRCGWWVNHSPDAIASAMERAMQKPVQELSIMGERGRRWMERDFAWDQIAEQLLSVYHWLKYGGPPPVTVSI